MCGYTELILSRNNQNPFSYYRYCVMILFAITLNISQLQRSYSYFVFFAQKKMPKVIEFMCTTKSLKQGYIQIAKRPTQLPSLFHIYEDIMQKKSGVFLVWDPKG